MPTVQVEVGVATAKFPNIGDHRHKCDPYLYEGLLLVRIYIRGGL